MNPDKKMAKARFGMVMDAVFWANIALHLKLIQDASCETGWTDGISIGYNPEFINDLSLAQTKGFNAHEVAHVALGHHLRRIDRDPKLWNQACDYVVNLILIDAGFELPPGALIDKKFKDKSAEEVYSILQQSQQQSQDQKKNGKKSQSQKGQGQKGQGQKKGSGKEKGKDKGNDPGKCGEVRDFTGKDGGKPTEAEVKQEQAKVKVAVTQARQVAKKAGQMSGGLERMIEEILEVKIPWTDHIKRFVDDNARNDYSSSPFNRRYIPMELFLPSIKSDELKCIVIVFDTSGSIYNQLMSKFAARVSSILEDFDTTVIVIYADSQVKGVEEFTTQDLPIKLNPKGGGGTNFKPAFKYVEDNGIEPSCLIYLTDLKCWQYPDPPNYPVMWGCIEKGKREVPFGEVIHVD